MSEGKSPRNGRNSLGDIASPEIQDQPPASLEAPCFARKYRASQGRPRHKECPILVKMLRHFRSGVPEPKIPQRLLGAIRRALRQSSGQARGDGTTHKTAPPSCPELCRRALVFPQEALRELWLQACPAKHGISGRRRVLRQPEFPQHFRDERFSRCLGVSSEAGGESFRGSQGTGSNGA